MLVRNFEPNNSMVYNIKKIHIMMKNKELEINLVS